MGRCEWLDKPTARCHLFRLEFIDGYYDSGGAYWGAPANVWCCTDGDQFRIFVRAKSRPDAFALVVADFPNHGVFLKRNTSL